MPCAVWILQGKRTLTSYTGIFTLAVIMNHQLTVSENQLNSLLDDNKPFQIQWLNEEVQKTWLLASLMSRLFVIIPRKGSSQKIYQHNTILKQKKWFNIQNTVYLHIFLYTTYKFEEARMINYMSLISKRS